MEAKTHRIAAENGVLLYDADCGFCTMTSTWAQRRLRLAAAIMALQSVDAEALGVDPARATEQVPFVTAEGDVLYGHEAIAATLRTGNPALRAIGGLMVSAPASPAFAAVYAWVARHRHQLPGGTANCEITPAPAPQR